MTAVAQDTRYALRMLRKSPTLALVAVVTLALGVGANTVMFCIVNGFLRPLPVPKPQEVMVLATQQKGGSIFAHGFSYPDLADFRKQTNTFSDVFAYGVDLVGLNADGKADQFVVSYVTGNYFSALELKPELGRFFLPDEGETPGDSPFLVLAHSYWKNRFAGDPAIVGKQVLVNGKGVTIIGVAPRGFHGVYSMVAMDGYLPLNQAIALGGAPATGLTDRRRRLLRALGRLKPEASRAQAQSEANVIAERLAEEYSDTNKGISIGVIPEWLSRPEPLPNNLVPAIAGLFLALAGLVLLLACMNVANLMLVRATVRRHEMGIRAALGASRGRLTGQMLTESSVLALLAGAGGLMGAAWAGPGMIESARMGGGVPVRMDFSFDWRVFAYAFAAVVVTAMVVGLWPALRASRTDLNTVLHEGGRSDSAGGGRHRLRNALVVAQIAGSLMLLVAAGLFARSLSKAQRMYLGFDPDHLVKLTVYPRELGYDETRTKDFYRDLKERITTLPGIQSVAMSYSVPMSGSINAGAVYVEGHPTPAGQQPPVIFFNNVDQDYFETARVPLLRGRAFRESDDEKEPLVAIINQTMARQFWPNEDPIGKRLSVTNDGGPFIQVVGVAADGKYLFIGESPQPYFYVPLAQNFSSFRTLEIRTAAAPETMIGPVREVVHGLAPGLPIFDLETMEQSLEGVNGFLVFRAGAQRATQMGILGFVLAIVGVFGVVSYAAAQRTHEIGIRMALGASQGDILKLMLRQGVSLVLGGVALGLVAAWGLTRAMGRLLIGVSPTDPLTYMVATLALAAIALWACYLPARRAMRVDPLVALRHE